MKKVLKLLLILLLSLGIFACKSNNPKIDKQNTNENNNTETPGDELDTKITIDFDFDDPLIIASNKVKNYDLSYDPSELNILTNSVKETLENKKGLVEVKNSYDKLVLYKDSINKLFIIITALHYAKLDSEEMANHYNNLNTLILQIDEEINKLDIIIANSEYAKEFFSNLTDEQLEELKEKKVDDTEYIDLINKKNDIIYKISTTDGNKDNYLNEFVKINKEIAKLKTGDDLKYIDYSDKIYKRDYPDDLIDCIKYYNKVFLLDCYEKIDDERRNISDEDFAKIDEYKFTNPIDDPSIFQQFAITMGETYCETFNDYFLGGYYIYSNYSNTNGLGYCDNYKDLTLMFFGEGCQDLSTFVHEFGHYYSFVNNYGNHSCDFSEFESQGNEVLYRLYLEEYKHEDGAKEFSIDFLDSLLFTIVSGSAMREYEELIYSIDVAELDVAWNIIIKNYNDILPTYWYQLISDYDNYYISYSTSGLLALALYIYGKQNSYISACELYYKIITYDGEGDLFEAIKETQLKEIDYIFYSNIHSYITHMMFK